MIEMAKKRYSSKSWRSGRTYDQRTTHRMATAQTFRRMRSDVPILTKLPARDQRVLYQSLRTFVPRWK